MKTITPEQLKEILAKHKEWRESLGERGERAYLSDAYLRGADLSGADLSDAYLRRAYLSDADLRDADLSGADLSGADLSDADLRDAHLSDADLRDADLSDAYLRGADLSGADLSDAYLRGAYLRGADLSGADLRDADLRDDLRELLAVPELDKKILEAIESGGKLDMQSWHRCKTTHCRAGWAVVVAGEKGALLESLYGTNTAASLMYAASRPDKRIPDFFAPTDVAMESIRADAQ